MAPRGALGDANPATGTVVVAPGLGLQHAHLGFDAQAPLEQGRTGVGQVVAEGMAPEQLQAQVLLELINAPQHGGVGYGKFGRRTRYRSLARDGEIVADRIPALHARIIHNACARLWNGCERELLAHSRHLV